MQEWLLSELKAAASTNVSARFALDLSDQRVTLLEKTAIGFVKRRSAAHGDPDFATAVSHMRAVVARHRRDAPVDLMLPDELTLFRVETFPAQARRHLRDEAWWRLDAMTPYRPDDLCYDVALLSADGDTLTVHIAVAPREIVEEAVLYARDWGFSPQRVTSSAEADGFGPGPLFAEAASARRAARSLRASAVALAAVVGVLAVLGVSRGVLERQALAEAAEARRVEAEATLAEALTLRTQTLALAERAMRPADLRLASRVVVDWLDALARALPPDASADRIVLDGSGLRIEGAAQNAAAVLSALDVAEEFGAVLYAAVPDPDPDAARLHRFAIEARLRPLAEDGEGASDPLFGPRGLGGEPTR